jgi:hypothetical protein
MISLSEVVSWTGLTTYIVIYRCNQNRSNHEEPVRNWDIELAMKDLRSVNHLDLWEV